MRAPERPLRPLSGVIFALVLALHRADAAIINAADIHHVNSSSWQEFIDNEMGPLKAIDGSFDKQWVTQADPSPFLRIVFFNWWTVSSYELSVYGLYGPAATAIPSSWNLTCIQYRWETGIEGVNLILVDQREGITLSTDDTSTSFTISGVDPLPSCNGVQLDFPPDAAVALAEVYLKGVWAPSDACFDSQTFSDSYGYTCNDYRANPSYCDYFSTTAVGPLEPWNNATVSCCKCGGGCPSKSGP